MTYTPHRHPDGTINLPRTAAQLSLDLHPVGSSLLRTARILADIRELLPKRGELTDQVHDLVQELANLERVYERADQALMDVAFLAQHEADTS